MDSSQSGIEGVVERIVFFNDENCYCVASMKPVGRGAPKENITIAGIMPALQCGETVVVKGEWSRHSVYGAQIKVREFKSKLPSDVYGIEKFLGSGLIEGIGAVYARKIVEKFGEETLKVIDSDSARLREIKGIGAERAKKIKSSWDGQRGLRDVMIALRTYGIGMSVCVRIMRKFGSEAPDIVRTQPYKLMREIDGIGFKTADMIAINIGIPNESAERLEAGILHLLSENEADGSTCMPSGELISRAAAMLATDPDKCANALSSLANQCAVKYLNPNLVQTAPLDFSERGIASSLKRIFSAPSDLPPIKAERAAQWARDKAGFDFAPEQNSAIVAALTNKISILTGGPGTGKTTILKAICAILQAKNVRPVLAAPTGRAAQRMSESAGIEAKTIHRLLGSEDGKFSHGPNRHLDGTFFIIDETSMLDTRLAAALVGAIPDSAHLLLVGDIDQLPSVGAGAVLKDIIESERFSLTRLSKIFRQGAGSSIVKAAHDIISGSDSMDGFEPRPLADIDPSNDISFVLAQSPSECVDSCVSLIRDKIPRWYGCDPIADVQLLAPMHKGDAGISAFNIALKEALCDKRADFLPFGASRFSVGDKIMQTRNNYDIDIFNGDMGRVVSVDSDGGGITADFDGKKIALGKSDLADFQQAYAVSIHKSQGSEFPIVVLPLTRQHFIMLQRNLLYTGVTRGRKKVFAVGDPSAWSAAVKNARAASRRTFLKDRLKLWE